jgi:hypothetical protein
MAQVVERLPSKCDALSSKKEGGRRVKHVCTCVFLVRHVLCSVASDPGSLDVIQ